MEKTYKLTFDSRTVEPGDVFFALRGYGGGADGHDFIAQAVERGAATVVCEVGTPTAVWANAGGKLGDETIRRLDDEAIRQLDDGANATQTDAREGLQPAAGGGGWLTGSESPKNTDAGGGMTCQPSAVGGVGLKASAKPEEGHFSSTRFVVVEDSHKALGEMAAEFYGHPSRRLKLVGVTGTNGKTTTATLLYDLVRALGHEAGLVSTVDYRIGDTVIPSTHTTPDAIRLNEMMAEMVKKGCEYCFMEVSSHAIDQKRIAGLDFNGGVFTNITHDHLDYHETFAGYIAVKKRFFDELGEGAFALVNIDDRNGRVMVQNTKARVKTLSLRTMADYRCRVVEQHADGMLLAIDGVEVWVGFIGRFNAYNLLTVYAAARELGFDREDVLRVLSALKPVSGRFETVSLGGSEAGHGGGSGKRGGTRGVTAIVDYAHTPDALENVLRTIAEIRRPRTRIFTVVGCGGERDRAKRPAMARIAASGSDLTILTSDNPRSEDPAAIIDEMRAGLEPNHKAICVPDRGQAIRTAVAMATEGDMILVAGKGHETYQIVGSEKHHFDDKEELKKAFECYTV